MINSLRLNTLFWGIVLRDLLLALRYSTDTLGAVFFLIVTTTLFPLALGPSLELLRRMAPGILWVCTLLAALLPLERIFARDVEDGTLDHLLLMGISPSFIALAKMLTHWLTTGVPLLLMSGPLALMLNLPLRVFPVLFGGIFLGTLILSLIGGMGACIVLGARHSSMILSLLSLPLITPALIFGAGSLDAAVAGLPWKANMELLGAFFAITLPLCPLAAGASLRIAAE